MRSEFGKLLLTSVDRRFKYGEYQFSRSVSATDRREALRLRQLVYMQERYIEPPVNAGEVFEDEFDAIAEHLVVHDCGGRIVGTTRFILPSDLGYPTERLFNIRRPAVKAESLGEFSRLAIADGHRGGRREPMIGLLKLVYEVMILNGITNVYAFMAPKLIESYARLGCVSTVLEQAPVTPEIMERRMPMRGYFARESIHPVLFRLEEMIPRILAQ